MWHNACSGRSWSSRPKIAVGVEQCTYVLVSTQAATPLTACLRARAFRCIGSGAYHQYVTGGPSRDYKKPRYLNFDKNFGSFLVRGQSYGTHNYDDLGSVMEYMPWKVDLRVANLVICNWGTIRMRCCVAAWQTHAQYAELCLAAPAHGPLQRALFATAPHFTSLKKMCTRAQALTASSSRACGAWPTARFAARARAPVTRRTKRPLLVLRHYKL